MKKLSLVLVAAALTAVGGMAANAVPLPAGTLAPAPGVAGAFDDNMFVFKPGLGGGLVEGFGVTTSQIDSCSGPGTPFHGGCLFTVPNAAGIPLNGNLGSTLVYEPDGVTLSDAFGVTCNDAGCNLAYLSSIGNTPIDLTGLDTTTAYSVTEIAGAPVTVFDATYYLTSDYRAANPGVFARFISANDVPEPATLTLFGAGMLGAAAIRRRKKRG